MARPNSMKLPIDIGKVKTLMKDQTFNCVSLGDQIRYNEKSIRRMLKSGEATVELAHKVSGALGVRIYDILHESWYEM